VVKLFKFSKTHGVKCIIVDDEDIGLLLLRNWVLRKHRHTFYAYAQKMVKGLVKQLHLHREIMGKDARHVDHIEGNGLDNRRSKLRWATTRENTRNKRSAGGASKYKGVCLNDNGRWRVRARLIDGRRVYLGSYATEHEAALAYDAHVRAAHGEFAALNFPGPGEQSALR
jgi:hypothetical protein